MTAMHLAVCLGALQTTRILDGSRVKIVTAIEHGGIVVALLGTAGHRTGKFFGQADAAHLGKQGREQLP